MVKRDKILVVDDVELNRAILAELFKQYEVIEAENGAEALEKLDAFGDGLAAVLLDIVMPVMDGFEFLDNFKNTQWFNKIPIVLITADSADNTFIKGYGAGVADIINKPFNPEVVSKRVANIVELFDYKENLEITVEEQLFKLKKQAEELRQFNSLIIETLSTVVEFRDHESGNHVKNIRELMRVLLPELIKSYGAEELSDEEISTIADASVLHDIGKIAIPDAILLKPGKLTPDEYETIKKHTLIGCQILDRLNYMKDNEYFKYCYDICRHHHERWDGRGYPDGLKGDEISLWAQAASLADVYEALVSERVYKKRLPHDVAVKMIINGECGAFNPLLLESFVKVAPALKSAGYETRTESQEGGGGLNV